MKFLYLIWLNLFFCEFVQAQFLPETIQSSFVLQSERQKLKQSLYERTIRQSFLLTPDSISEYRYQSAFWAITQFMVADSSVMEGFRKTISAYGSLAIETRRSFLEAIYTLNPKQFQPDIKQILSVEQNPKVFAMSALFTYRNEPGYKENILQMMEKKFPDHSTNVILSTLKNYLENNEKLVLHAIPNLQLLFTLQKKIGIKTIYSLQRWNRDFTGLAIIQESGGKFSRDNEGKLIVVRQLARAGSNLPYFITNGNTPQGIFSIQGIDTSHNNFIGPTPNLQLTMPFEGYWQDYFHANADSTNPLAAYSKLLPESWQSYTPMQEAFVAGKAGRTEIIAHGTTIDPAFFIDKTYFPISPTLGCLCAQEIWNPITGKLGESEQLKLINTFLQSPGEKGYLFVINLDNQQRAVSQAELEKFVSEFESSFSNK